MMMVMVVRDVVIDISLYPKVESIKDRETRENSSKR